MLDFLHVKYVIGVGEGAGANVLARFGLAHPSRCLGLILINVTGSAASVLDVFKTKFISWKGDEVGQSAEDFLLYHKFGYVSIEPVAVLDGDHTILYDQHDRCIVHELKKKTERIWGKST